MQVRPYLAALVASLFIAPFFAPLFAQRDTVFVNVRTETGELVKQDFVDEYDFVFLNKEPLRFMAKWNAAGALPIINTDWQALGGSEGTDDWRLEGALEVKIAPSISVNGLVSVALAGDGDQIIDYIGLGLEPRYYINQKRRIREGKSAKNLTGTYLGLSFIETRNAIELSNKTYNYQNHDATLRMGFQHRVFRNGYLDFSWGLGAATRTHITLPDGQEPVFSRKWREQFSQRLALGWAFGSPRTARRDNRTCDFFKCYREESRLWKFDALNLVRLLDFERQSGKLGVAFEQKIKESPFSVQVEALALGSHTDIRNEFWRLKQHSLGAGFYVEPRWYYSLKKRIATGKSGNNLNGVFVGLNTGLLSTRSYYDYPELDPVYIDRYIRAVPVWGVQYRIFDRGFFEYRVGMGIEHALTDTDFRDAPSHVSDPPSFITWQASFLSELKIGFAF
ncbi:MAG: hypothetical protein ACK4Q5_01945 [Saprospiraceae bacterium]